SGDMAETVPHPAVLRATAHPRSGRSQTVPGPVGHRVQGAKLRSDHPDGRRCNVSVEPFRNLPTGPAEPVDRNHRADSAAPGGRLRNRPPKPRQPPSPGRFPPRLIGLLTRLRLRLRPNPHNLSDSTLQPNPRLSSRRFTTSSHVAE